MSNFPNLFFVWTPGDVIAIAVLLCCILFFIGLGFCYLVQKAWRKVRALIRR